MKKCVHLSKYNNRIVCGNTHSKHVQSKCVKCPEYLSQSECCPHIGECGHSGEGMYGCGRDAYCPYRNLTWGDGKKMPQKLQNNILEMIRSAKG